MIYRFFLLVVILSSFLSCVAPLKPILIENEYNNLFDVTNYGVNGADDIDDWAEIQSLIDKVCADGGGTVYFPKGKYIIENKTLLVWCSNVRLLGESNEEAQLIRRGKGGWWGELLSISGKSTGGKYYGGFGTLDYDRFLIYGGKRLPSENIVVENLLFDSEIPFPSQSNNIGVVNSKNVLIKKCIIKNAPKSNVAIVNITTKSINKNITLDSCIFKNSGQHNVRVISYNQGKFIGNSVLIKNSRFINVRNVDRSKEIKGKKVHLWYRAGLGSDLVFLNVENSFFDSSGIIAGTINVDNLTIVDSDINGSIYLKINKKNYPNPKIKLINNKFVNDNIEKSINSNAEYIIKH